MELSVFLRGLAIGFGIAAPVGPIGILCIRRTLVDGGGGYGPATLMVVGVFLGSAFWWLLLSTGVGFLRSSITPAHLRWVNRGAAIIFTAFGLVALLSLLT